MVCFAILQTIWLFALLTITITRAQRNFYDTSCPVSQEKQCVNLGGRSNSIGEFRGDKGIVTYMNLGGAPKAIRTNNLFIKGTTNPLAFVEQMSHPQSINFFVAVDLGYKYDIELGFAHIANCNQAGVSVQVRSQGSKSNIFNVKKVAGCRKVSFVKLKSLAPSSWRYPNTGKLSIAVSKIAGSGPVTVATLCIVQSKRAGLSYCSQGSCRTFTGRYGYVTAYGHGCQDYEDYTVLKVPANARIVKSFIRWGLFYNEAKERSRISINDKLFLSDKSDVASFVGVYSSDITELVSKAGFSRPYKISNFDSKQCSDTAWSFVVIYQLETLPISNINLCGTVQTGHTVSYEISCIYPGKVKKAKLNIHFLETFGDNPERLFVNSKLVARNFSIENVGWGSTYASYDVTKLMKVSAQFFNVTRSGGTGREAMAIVDLIETI